MLHPHFETAPKARIHNGLCINTGHPGRWTQIIILSLLKKSFTYLLSSQFGTMTLRLYNVQVIQFWRGAKEHRRPYPLHWAIYVETSSGIGNTYEIIGNPTNYAINIRLNQPLANAKDCRGGYVVGRVNWLELDEMERILPRVDIIHNLPCWNSHDWVDDALRYLKCWGFSNIIGETELSRLQDDMCWLLESWPGIETAVEFVGDSEDLACVLANRRSAEVHLSFWRSNSTWRWKCTDSRVVNFD
ncbi:hypothetical protein EDB19DRAFT_1060043 [Suillus lakei]|nr:hypothetical protein EDB19DRAFT_1060043 [Suillus lakei]